MDLQTIMFIVSGVLTVAASLIGVRYVNVKKALKETKEAVVVIIDAIEDDKITADETTSIVKEVKEAAVAWGLVFKKND